jgi:DNA-binding NtrC family response regulator
MNGPRILLVDGDSIERSELSSALREHGMIVETAIDGFRALHKLDAFDADLVVADLRLFCLSGAALLPRLRDANYGRAFVVISEQGDLQGAVEAIDAGAFGHLTRPVDVGKLLSVIRRATPRRRTRARHGHDVPVVDARRALLGSSAAMELVHRSIEQVAPARASVLITGESGTGKELVAAALHAQSPRAARAYVRVHCAALAETLLESELFGHERGAFTGAVTRREGRFQQADHGTLFLDEIGDISALTQIKLLRFLQSREFERVGGNETLHVDVRVVAATNHALAHDVAQGRFREDLYYRLNVVTIEVPPLRARREDISGLAEHFLRRFTAENGREIGGFTDDALECLMRHDWPGNVRELENVIERAVVVSKGEAIRRADLAPIVRNGHVSLDGDIPVVPGATLAEMERHMILKTLEHTSGCKARAARILGISPRTLQYRLTSYRAEASSMATAEGGSALTP